MRLIWRTVPLPWTSRDAVVKPPLLSAQRCTAMRDALSRPRTSTRPREPLANVRMAPARCSPSAVNASSASGGGGAATGASTARPSIVAPLCDPSTTNDSPPPPRTSRSGQWSEPMKPTRSAPRPSSSHAATPSFTETSAWSMRMPLP